MASSTSNTQLPSVEIDSPVGALLVIASASAIVAVGFERRDWTDLIESASAEHRLNGSLSSAEQLLTTATAELDDYFAGLLKEFSVPVDLGSTTGFRSKVLGLTANIPFGETRSYGDLARAAGSPRAVRATGSAMGSNPVPIIVPCHRVVRSDGSAGRFGGGSEMKLRLLAHEAGQRQPGPSR